MLLVDPARGGQSHRSADGYVEGAPELVVEVAASSASYDLHAKLHAYRRNGVREYVVWRVLDGAIDWFVLEAGAYVRQTPDAAEVLRSSVFPGLWLDGAALLAADYARVMSCLDQGLACAEHAAFRERLG